MASVDVLVPCYQYGRFLRECVESVLVQDIRDLRVLIIDNASTDDSLEVARRLSAEDSRVGVVAHARNLGHLASFNEGIDWASSDYFMILCADDLLAPACLSRAVSFMERFPDVNMTFGLSLPISSTDAIPMIEHTSQSEQWRIIPGETLLEGLCRTGRPDPSQVIIDLTTTVVRTSAQKRAGYYREELPHTADLEMWLRFSCFGHAAETRAVQALRRYHSQARSASLSDVQMWDLYSEAAFESFFANEGALLPNSTRLHRIARRALADRAYWGSIANLLRGNTPLALRLWKFAISREPSAIVVPPIRYLLRRQDAFSHIGQVISESRARFGLRARALFRDS